MKRSSRRLASVLATGVIITGALAIGSGITPAFAAPAHQPKAQANRPKLTADQIVRVAVKDMRSASAARGYIHESELGFTIAITETFTEQGCMSYIVISGQGTSIVESVLIIGTTAWVQPDTEFWKLLGYTGSELASLQGKWVTEAAFEKLFGITGLPTSAVRCDIGAAAAGIPSHGWTLGRTARVNGRWAWRVINKSMKGDICLSLRAGCKPLTTTAYVSDTRNPEFVSLTTLGITEHFYDYNAPITLAAPPANDVLTSLPPLPGGGGSLEARSLNARSLEVSSLEVGSLVRLAEPVH
jgi:hypothetical protein